MRHSLPGQGYLLVSITLLGPGDTPKVHGDTDEVGPMVTADGQVVMRVPHEPALLLPPPAKQETPSLAVFIACAVVLVVRYRDL